MGRGKRRERLSLLTWSCATSLINVSKSPRVGGCGGNQGRGVGERARGRGPTVSKRGGKVGTKAKRQGGSHEEQHGTRPTSKRKAMLRFVSTCAPHSPTHRSTCFTWTQTEPLPCPNNPASTTPPPHPTAPGSRPPLTSAHVSPGRRQTAVPPPPTHPSTPKTEHTHSLTLTHRSTCFSWHEADSTYMSTALQVASSDMLAEKKGGSRARLSRYRRWLRQIMKISSCSVVVQACVGGEGGGWCSQQQ